MDNTKNEVYVPVLPVEPDLDIVDRDRFDRIDTTNASYTFQKVFACKNIAFIKGHLPAKGAITNVGASGNLNTANIKLGGFGLRDQILSFDWVLRAGFCLGHVAPVCAVTVSPTIKVSAKIPRNFI